MNVCNIADRVTNSVYTDQTLCSAASDQGLHFVPACISEYVE